MGSFKDKFKTYQAFFEEHEGSIMCGCDHGCNQWIKKQEARLALSVRMLQKGSKNLDKMAQMPLERVNALWGRLMMEDCRRFNIKMRKSDTYTYYKRVLDFGLERVLDAITLHGTDYKAAAKELNGGKEPKASDYQSLGQVPYMIKSHDIRGYLDFIAMTPEEQAECQHEWLEWNKRFED